MSHLKTVNASQGTIHRFKHLKRKTVQLQCQHLLQPAMPQEAASPIQLSHLKTVNASQGTVHRFKHLKRKTVQLQCQHLLQPAMPQEAASPI